MKNLRRQLLMATALLVVTGVVMTYSTSAIYAQEMYGDSTYFLKRHLVYLSLGILISGWILSIDPGQIRRRTKGLMLFALILLFLVLLPGIGHRVSGASRWFRFGWMSFQPSELAQLALILYLADVLSRKRGELEDFLKGLLPPLVVLGATVALILAEPDLGTAAALICVALGLFFIAGIRGKILVPLLVVAIPVLVGLILSKPYRIRRILAYLNPWADPEGAGFQLIQSLVALGSGGLLGLGLGESRQKLFYLPAAHTDFIFSVIGEELGLLGTSALLALLGFFFYTALKIALRAPDSFGVFAGLGIVVLLALEASVHMGVTTGLIPTKGLPLPFISYGGTALVINLVSVAILLNLSRSLKTVAG